MKTITLLLLALVGCTNSTYSPVIDCQANEAGVYPVWCERECPEEEDSGTSIVTPLPKVK